MPERITLPERLNVHIGTQMLQELRELSVETGVPVAAHLRLAVAAYLKAKRGSR